MAAALLVSTRYVVVRQSDAISDVINGRRPPRRYRLRNRVRTSSEGNTGHRGVSCGAAAAADASGGRSKTSRAAKNKTRSLLHTSSKCTISRTARVAQGVTACALGLQDTMRGRSDYALLYVDFMDFLVSLRKLLVLISFFSTRIGTSFGQPKFGHFSKVS